MDNKSIHSYLLVWTQPYLLPFYPNPCPPHLLWKAMSSVSCNYAMSCLITSLQYYFDLTIPFLNPSIADLSQLRGAFVHVIIVCSCSNYLNLAFRNLASREVTPTLSQISSFLILSLLIYHIAIITFSSSPLSLSNHHFVSRIVSHFLDWFSIITLLATILGSVSRRNNEVSLLHRILESHPWTVYENLVLLLLLEPALKPFGAVRTPSMSIILLRAFNNHKIPSVIPQGQGKVVCVQPSFHWLGSRKLLG